eukprot:CAMPEP_0177639788 /NCGR_PEP_ID=MMETSP0447-20121125/6205_1 /TAXON_ID=0 /ORGANISM="Stygamoeba regulata, Strain BSH-02190019" /LENGTH=714 /DNA_ID=CAMNT_0019141833 /DNA_START=57 /DNA_END=2201 /DNA_ORIENTATION=+
MHAHTLAAFVLACLCLVAPSNTRALPPVYPTDVSIDACADADMPPDVAAVGVSAVVAWAQQRVRCGEQRFSSSHLTRMPSPTFWGDGIVYQIMVDRFNNGNITNDDTNLTDQQRQYGSSGNPYGLPDYRHGGDLLGIELRLDYLADLGVNTLWVTPVLMHTGAYHGYCTTDPTRVDPGFGSPADLQRLVAQAHARGMRVVLDIVANHLCDVRSTYAPAPSHYCCANELDKEFWAGQEGGSGCQGSLSFSPDFFGPLHLEAFFSRCGANSNSDTSGNDPVSVYGDFVSGMFDYDTRNWDFQQIYTLLHMYWIAYADIDGFRVDAAKHVSEDFMAYFSTQARAYALSLGKKNFFIVGEVAGPPDWIGRRLGNMFCDPKNPHDHGNIPQGLFNRILDQQATYQQNPVARYPGLSAVYDFATSGTTRDVLLGQRASAALPAAYTSDNYNTIAGQADPRLSWTLLEIHDWPRFIHDDAADPGKVKAGLVALLTSPGQPIIYYGLEQGFNGNCGGTINAGDATATIKQTCQANSDACFRQDMFQSGPWRLRSAVPEIDSLNYVGVWNATAPYERWQDDPFLRTDHSVYVTARAMVHIRASCSALRTGAITFRMAGGGRGDTFAYSRINDQEEVVVIVNPGLYTASITKLPLDSKVNYNAAGQQYQNLFNGNEKGTVGYEGSTPFLYFDSLQVSPDAFFVFVRAGNTGPYDSRLGCSLCLS